MPRAPIAFNRAATRPTAALMNPAAGLGRREIITDHFLNPGDAVAESLGGPVRLHQAAVA